MSLLLLIIILVLLFGGGGGYYGYRTYGGPGLGGALGLAPDHPHRALAGRRARDLRRPYLRPEGSGGRPQVLSREREPGGRAGKLFHVKHKICGSRAQ